MRALHSSGWWEADLDAVRAAVTQWAYAYISRTEAARHRSAFKHPDYQTFHAFGTSGEAECAVMVRVDRTATAKAVRLSPLPIPRRQGDQCWAMHVTETAPLPHHTIVVHLPSGVEGLRGLLRGAQADVWRDSVEGLKRLVAGLDGSVRIVGDWNINARHAWVRRYLEREFPEFALTRFPARTRGTHGRRVIDFSLSRGFITTGEVVSSLHSSDHRAVAERIEETVMANRYPKALWEPLGRQTEERMTAHDIICLHTMVGTLAGTDAMFEADGFGGTESHWGTGGAGEQVKQWQDMAYSADANLEGWRRVLSIENADKDPGFPAWSGSDVPGFTAKQLDQLVDLVAWLCSREAHSACPSDWKCHREGIPAALIPDSKPGRRGIGYHRQGIDGSLPDMRVSGGEAWSTSRGKICPGDRRVKQIREDLVPRVAARLNPPKPTRVERARADLETALARSVKAGRTKRAAAIRAALKALPKR